MFHDLGNSPATFEASRWADFLGCVEGWEVQVADAIQAYIQAYIQGPALWVELPKEGWPEDGSWNKFRRPCVRMVKALYGHPDAGTFWEEHCHKGVTAVGFEPVGAAWPSVYVHKELNLLLVVYVDDFKMAGPKQNLAKGWTLLRKNLSIEPETGLGLYLRCNQLKGTAVLDGQNQHGHLRHGGVPRDVCSEIQGHRGCSCQVEGGQDSFASGGSEEPPGKNALHGRQIRGMHMVQTQFQPRRSF